MNRTVQVHLTSLVNASKIRKETRNGREVIVVPSATLPDGIIMNGIRYSAEAIARSYKSLERTMAPVGHPKIGNSYVSSFDPEAINQFHIGAWNENVRQEGGRVLLDKVIDVEVAKSTEKGKEVLNAIDKGEPIHTSTGLIADLAPGDEEKGYKYDVVNMTFDHDAILLNEPGAATPEQGVGMLVNNQRLDVINSAIEAAESELDWAGQHLIRSLDRLQDASKWEKIKQTILSAILGEGKTTQPPEPEEEEEMKDEQVQAMNARFDALETAVTSIAATMTALNEAMAADAKKAEDEEAAKKAEAEKAVVNAKLATEDEAKQLPLFALNKLLEVSTAPKQAAALNGRPISTNTDKGEYAFPEEK